MHNTTSLEIHLRSTVMSFASSGTSMQENDHATRKRKKSNFDVLPSGDTDLSSADPAAAASKLAQAKAIAALLTAHPNTNSLASVSKFLPEGQTTLMPMSSEQPFQRDEVYYARLERAREKNINYIKRLYLFVTQVPTEMLLLYHSFLSFVWCLWSWMILIFQSSHLPIFRKDLEKLQKQARGEYEEPDFYFPSSKAPKQPRGNIHLKSGLVSVSVTVFWLSWHCHVLRQL